MVCWLNVPPHPILRRQFGIILVEVGEVIAGIVTFNSQIDRRIELATLNRRDEPIRYDPARLVVCNKNLQIDVFGCHHQRRTSKAICARQI